MSRSGLFLSHSGRMAYVIGGGGAGRLTLAALAAFLPAIFPPESLAQTEVPPSFAEAVLFSSGQRPHGIAAANLDEDDLPDIAYVTGIFELPPPGSPASGQVCVRLNTGDWSPTSDGLGDAQCYAIGSHCGSNPCTGLEIVIGKFNDDIWPDIAVTTNRNNTGQGIIAVFLNDPSNPGDNFFPSTSNPIMLPHYVRGLASGEFNGDGLEDLAAAGDPNNFVMTLHGNGAGGFTLVGEYELENALVAGDIIAGRVNSLNPSVSDLATSNSCEDEYACWTGINSISRLLNDGNGDFDNGAIIGPSTGKPFNYKNLAGGRLDSDQLLDLVCIERKPNSVHNSTDYHMAVFRHDPVTEEFIHVRPSGDNTGDHYKQVNNDLVRLSAVAIGHLNTGNKRDCVVAVSFDEGSTPPHVVVWVGKGDGTFDRGTAQNPMPLTFPIAPTGASAGKPYGIVIVDLNDDGLNDIVTSNKPTSNLSVLINNSQ